MMKAETITIHDIERCGSAPYQCVCECDDCVTFHWILGWFSPIRRNPDGM